jgi:enoyl-CoA hydratase/long-chain 3-hydroxyacyl-CoA dehydrogenase
MREKKVPFVAAIDGPASWWLEWALWCDYRICNDQPKRPKWVFQKSSWVYSRVLRYSKLARTRWIANAMDMMLTGKRDSS